MQGRFRTTQIVKLRNNRQDDRKGKSTQSQKVKLDLMIECSKYGDLLG